METDIPTRPVSPEDYRITSLPKPSPRFARPPSPPLPPSTPSPPPPPSVPYTRRGISRELEERFPVVVAHSPNHQRLWDRLAVGTLWKVAQVTNDLGLNLDLLDGEILEELVGNNSTMGRVEEILRRARKEEWIQRETPDETETKQIREVSAELDWEAEQIVAGNGEMLGWREERGTRYGGKVQFAATLKLEEKVDKKGKRPISKNSPLDLDEFGRLVLEPPSIRGSSIFTRTFGSHHFLRVRVSKRVQTEFSVWCKSADERAAAQKVVKEWSKRPIFILGRVYSFFREKDDVNFYFLEGQELVGQIFDHGRRGYGLPECASVYDLIEWWGPLAHNGNQDFNKLCTRLELGLSDTLPGMFIRPDCIEVADDIVNDENVEFTDGAGIATPSVAHALRRKYGDGASASLHMAYQIRVHTAKGVVLIDPESVLNGRNSAAPHRLKLYKSMVKSSTAARALRPGPANGYHILDAACNILCVVKPAPSSSASGARLSSQFITILAERGVPPQVFLDLQAEAVRKELAIWTDIATEEHFDHHKNEKYFRVDENTRLRLARTIAHNKALHLMVKKRELGGAAKGLGYGRTKKTDRTDEVEEDESEIESSDEEPAGLMAVGSFESFTSITTNSGKVQRYSDPWTANEISGLPALKSEQLRLALLAGIDVPRSNWFSEIWIDMAKTAMLSFVTKFHLPVARSASGFFQPGPTGILEEGEVCFFVKEQMVDGETGLPVTSIEGDVVIGRHPALLPTDMQKVKGRAIEFLRHHAGIIFCSVKGAIPLASLCAGGDYDGDEGTIIWERSIVDNFHNADPSLRLPPPGFEDRFEKVGVKTSQVERQLRGLTEPERTIQLTKRLVDSVAEGNTFKIYNSFANMATYRDGVQGYWKSEDEFVKTQTALIMGHTFNSLMDSRKTGIRIKPKVLARDKAEWSVHEEPYWLRRQKNLVSSPFSKQNLRPLRPRDMRTHVLDQLVLAGEDELARAIKLFQDKLRPKARGTGELYFDGNGTDSHLTYHWRAAEHRAEIEPGGKAELQKIKDGVIACQNRFKHLNMESARKITTIAQRKVKLRQICDEYSRLGTSIDGGKMGMEQDELLRFVKASCAYVCDATKRGGADNGFAWHVAMRDLCEIKARALAGGHIVAVPYSVMEKLDVHRHWS
ncbi:hypothetical protein M408DRAFT_332479 [Serendipita vermifera MAFF 305830]|uniref:RNA-dependent RNA polymerase n=1 Tax=Serendipita vermifera MAFF 305830 TaxID=933852 RepID=A0A0C3AT42_SERVB|nr:hypothetical protein M408DRAFT_332479 [Serendipita vermifera MAFF 305830]